MSFLKCLRHGLLVMELPLVLRQIVAWQLSQPGSLCVAAVNFATLEGNMKFEQWYKKVKFTKTAYFARDLRPLLLLCWKAAKPNKKMTRSQKQNRYYFGVICDILSKDTGYLREEIHQLLAKQFLSYENQGEMFVRSTTTLSTAKFEEYLSNCRRFASMELSCYLPLPNETEYDYK
jgi:hypothetical protein